MKMLTVLDLFSGIGAFSLGLERAGMKTISFCEIDPFCRRVLAKHWPDVPILGDVTTAEFPRVDVICGGFPCQDVSRAGKRAGVTGKHSGLYRQLVRAIRVVRPQHAVVENVAALLDDGMGRVLGDVAESGFDAEWDCVPAKAIGAPHERDRVWIAAHAASHGCGQGWSRRPPDSFAWIRDATRRNATDATSAHDRSCYRGSTDGPEPEFGNGAGTDCWQSKWPSEPALLGMDDGLAERMDRVRSLGNSLVPQIPELIGRAIMAAERATVE